MDTDWIKLPIQNAKAESLKLAALISARVSSKIEAKEYALKDIEYVAKLKRPLVRGELNLDNELLEKLRRVCQLWDINFRASNITSHRKFIGPIIVALKKAVLPIIKILMRDVINQQRDFNAATINLLADLSQRADNQKLEKKL